MDDRLRIDRRTTLAWFSAATAGLGLVALPLSATAASGLGPQEPARADKGYGNDPDLLNPSVPWARTMSARQLLVAGLVADMILPPTPTAPAPSAVGIPDFIDEWVSAPYPDQQRDRGLILPHLLWLDTEATKRWGSPFDGVTNAQRFDLLSEISRPAAPSDQAAALRYGFFRRLRSITVGAYYSLERNFEELGYVGNKPLASFPPPTGEELSIINKASAALGLN